MKTTILMRHALWAVVLIVFSLVGCEEVDIYSIDSPSDLQARIDSIAAAKAAQDTGDTTFIDISTTIVGAEDNSTGWNGAHSDYFTIPTGKLLHLEFVNHGTGVNNWNNWNLAVTNVEENSEDYDPNNGEVGYFTLRADAWGWGNDDFDIGVVSHNYPDTDGDDDIWNDFRTTMQGAYVTIEVDHAAVGYAFVTATAEGTNGTVLEMTYNQPVSATEDIAAFLVVDGSHFEMKEAFLLPSRIEEIVDAQPVSIDVAGAPAALEIGNENFWGNATATVTFDDGSSTAVDSADLSINVIPDMTTVGEKTILVAYNKTKQGELTQAVSTFYNLNVINAVSSLEITTLPDVTTYTFPGPAAPVFDPTGMVVTATYSDGTTGVIANEVLQFEIPGEDGAQDAVVSYVGATSTVSTTVPITNVMGGTNQVGASDLSTGFWIAFSNEYNVASGSSKTFKMDLYSTEANNWNSPVVILRKADLTEYAVVRMDNFGWGDGYDGNDNLTTSHDWNFDVFAENLDGSYIEVTVTNVGDGTANIRYDVTYANGDTHFQLYESVAVDGSDLNCAITIDGCYVDITSVE